MQERCFLDWNNLARDVTQGLIDCPGEGCRTGDGCDDSQAKKC